MTNKVSNSSENGMNKMIMNMLESVYYVALRCTASVCPYVSPGAFHCQTIINVNKMCQIRKLS